MRHFNDILADVTARIGDEELAEQLIVPLEYQQLEELGDDRYLSLMCLRIFRAGLKHSMVDAKWPVFEEVFYQFDPVSVANMHDEALEELTGDSRLIRHWGKLQAVRKNAAKLAEISREQGSFGRYIANWPTSNIVGLWAELQQNFSQLGGSSGANFLRMAGKDTFLLDKKIRALSASKITQDLAPA